MYLALIYQARICTCISICNLVCMSTNNMLRSCSSYHKQLMNNMNEEIVYMQNLHMVTFNTEGNEKHQHDIMLSTQHTCILGTLTVCNHIRPSEQSICRSKDQVEAPSLHQTYLVHNYKCLLHTHVATGSSNHVHS